MVKHAPIHQILSYQQLLVTRFAWFWGTTRHMLSNRSSPEYWAWQLIRSKMSWPYHFGLWSVRPFPSYAPKEEGCTWDQIPMEQIKQYSWWGKWCLSISTWLAHSLLRTGNWKGRFRRSNYGKLVTSINTNGIREPGAGSGCRFLVLWRNSIREKCQRHPPPDSQFNQTVSQSYPKAIMFHENFLNMSHRYQVVLLRTLLNKVNHVLFPFHDF